MQKLESCLILTRSYYAKHEREFTKYIAAHSRTHYGGEDAKQKKVAMINKNILLSKINANMLIQCDEAINKG